MKIYGAIVVLATLAKVDLVVSSSTFEWEHFLTGDAAIHAADEGYYEFPLAMTDGQEVEGERQLLRGSKKKDPSYCQPERARENPLPPKKKPKLRSNPTAKCKVRRRCEFVSMLRCRDLSLYFTFLWYCHCNHIRKTKCRIVDKKGRDFCEWYVKV